MNLGRFGKVESGKTCTNLWVMSGLNRFNQYLYQFVTNEKVDGNIQEHNNSDGLGESSTLK